MKPEMRFALKPLALIAIALGACQTARDVAVTSFHVIDAPANYVRRHIDQESATTPAVAATSQSDVVTPGHPLVSPTPAQRKMVSEQRVVGSPSAETGTSHREMIEAKPKPSPLSASQRTGSDVGSKIPYAKPVPGKPGYVFSPFDPNGGYVDVTGYASGSKAKDPYSGQIFIVP